MAKVKKTWTEQVNALEQEYIEMRTRIARASVFGPPGNNLLTEFRQAAFELAEHYVNSPR